MAGEDPSYTPECPVAGSGVGAAIAQDVRDKADPFIPPPQSVPLSGVGAAITQYACDKGVDLVIVGNRRRKEGLSSVPTHM